jgi:hypothetical protein
MINVVIYIYIYYISFSFLDQSKIYVDIFIKIDRLTQLTKYYHNYQKLLLIQEWKKTIEFAQDKNITYWLRIYYDKLISVLHDQVLIYF